MGISVMPRNHY